jgi:glycosyltransferase involved in cell wall biosynthesis
MTAPTICLNMIVKNESKIIVRLLNSVLFLIDCYCICDTGSTDDTVEKITAFFADAGIPGKIIHEPFLNFAHNRNVALSACVGMSDFVLLMDADMVLRATAVPKTQWIGLGDHFSVLQGSDQFFYKNTRIVRNNGQYSYSGATHEYINTPATALGVLLQKEWLFIEDIGDGGAKGNKFQRDIALLLQGIKDEPNNVRNYFYLANSYHDIGETEKAMEYYQKRIDFKGWAEEVWYSHFRLGKCSQQLGNMAAAIGHWLDAYNTIPQRVESLYEIIYHYRLIGKQRTAFLFYEEAKKQLLKNLPREEHLFLRNDVYTYKLLVEYTILACYLNITNIDAEAVQIFNACPDSSITRNLLSNMKFYKHILVANNFWTLSFDTVRDLTIDDALVRFNSSSSCLLPKKGGGGGYWMNIRFVNYTINGKGEYLISGSDPDKIITLNRFVELSETFEIVRYFEFLFNVRDKKKRYVGVEDVRIFYASPDVEDSEILFIGTAQQENGRIGVSYGNYPVPPLSASQHSLAASFLDNICSDSLPDNSVLMNKELHQSFKPNVSCEKNWVFFHHGTKFPYVIYCWYPLTVCRLATGAAGVVNEITPVATITTVPKIFQHVRGSSCGFFVKETNETWFIVHMVSYETPRHYYHMIVVVSVSDGDGDVPDLNVLRYSAPFKFSDKSIEYSLSIVVEKTRVLINYSQWDRTTRLGIYPLEYIESLLIYH